MAKEKEVITVINNSVCHSVLMTALQLQLPNTVTRKANKIVMCTVRCQVLNIFFLKKKEKKKNKKKKKKKKGRSKNLYIYMYIINN